MKKILVIENGKLIRNTINHHLNDEEYEILLSDYIIKNSHLPKQIPDLVIADLTSIKNEKVELLMQLKNNHLTSIVPFLLITSGKNGGMKDFDSEFKYQLHKPYSENDLFGLIKKIFENSDNASPW